MGLLRLLGRIIALTLVPVILIAGMAFTVAFHDVLAGFIGDRGIAAFITTLLSVGAFIAVVWFCYYWTKTSGMSLFALND